MRANPRLSATTFGLAMLCASLWWSAFTTMTLLHDDAIFTHALGKALDSPSVRSAMADWIGNAVDAAAAASGSGRSVQGNPLVVELRKAVGSKTPIRPLTDAVTAVVLPARDAAVAQLDKNLEPKRPVVLELTPLFEAAHLKLDKPTSEVLGLVVSKRSVTLPLFTGAQLDLLQRRYDQTRFVDRWSGWLALALLAVSVLTSAKPLRTIALACAALALLAVAVPYLLTRIAGWSSHSDLGPLLTPTIAAARQTIGPYALPALAVGAVAALGFGAAQLVLTRRRSTR